MTDTRLDDDKEKPLDPAVIRVQERLQRLMLWSRGIMLVGFAALFGVIFYKFYWIRQTPVLPAAPIADLGLPVSAALPMPEGGHVTETHLEGGRLIVTIDGPKAGAVLVIDPETLRVLRRLDLPKGN